MLAIFNMSSVCRLLYLESVLSCPALVVPYSTQLRELVTTRLVAVRLGDVEVCPGLELEQEEGLVGLRQQVEEVLGQVLEEGGLREVGHQLLELRTRVIGEVDRVVMLSEEQSQELVVDCRMCGGLEEITFGVSNLVICAEEKDLFSEDGE